MLNYQRVTRVFFRQLLSIFCFFSNVFGQDQNMKTSILKYVFKDQDYWPWQTDFKVIIFSDRDHLKSIIQSTDTGVKGQISPETPYICFMGFSPW